MEITRQKTVRLAVFGTICLITGGIRVSAQVAAADPAIAGQQTAIAAMQESIARQRASVARQLGQDSAANFFILPPPAPLGTPPPPAVAQLDCPPLSDVEVHSLVDQAAQREGLDADLVRRVMQQESGFRPCAVSPKGAMGLMQLMPATAAQFGVNDSFDPMENVSAGAKFLKQLLARYGGDVVKAVSAYNAGPARVDAFDGIPPIPETLGYVDRIFCAGTGVALPMPQPPPMPCLTLQPDENPQ
ncbi:MAG TPA: lytic transglycosylase domain-containing protein [Bryobacteraceae bacterium]|nr:lytic transglycosylase domain-containing protein [Bryobacteraceae bacterium]